MDENQKRLESHKKKSRYFIAVIACLTLGLAPFIPGINPAEPHVLEKLRMLFSLSMRKPVDIFDLFIHSAPYGYLIYLVVTDLLSRFRK